MRNDVLAIVRMLAEDPLGAKREAYASPLPDDYYTAFEAIKQDADSELLVSALSGRAVGVLQLNSFLV